MPKINPLTRAKHKCALDLCNTGDFVAAKEIYQKICAKHRQDSEAWYMLGVIEIQLANHAQALAPLLQAVALTPEHSLANFSLGMAYQYSRDFLNATRYLSFASQLEPSNTNFLCAMGDALAKNAQPEKAIIAYNKALQIKPSELWAIGNLAPLYIDQGKIGEAIKLYRQGSITPVNQTETIDRNRRTPTRLHSNLLYCLHYQDGADPLTLFHEHQAWAKQHTSSIQPCQRQPVESFEQRKIRVGYVTPDLREHAVAYFLEPLLVNHNRSQFEIFCYAELVNRDSTTERMEQYVDTVRITTGQSDKTLAQNIAEDRIDVLIDLAGHTGENRLAVFAYKPAPIQISYLGYPNTTGLTQMDYRFTDEWADPIDASIQLHTEQLIRLDDGFLCFSPPSESPPVSNLPAMESGHLTFGVFNNPAKLTPRMQKLWVKLLHRFPESRIIIKHKQLNGITMHEEINKHFESHGIDQARIEIIGNTSKADHMKTYNKIDVAIDSFPYHGTTTTCDTLWMGIPVITIAGNMHVSRVGSSLLNQVNLGSMVVDDEDALLDLVAQLSLDLPKLAQIRTHLRDDMRQSSLCDGSAFAQKVEAIYTQLCHEHLAGSEI